jgi:hypothetical protein
MSQVLAASLLILLTVLATTERLPAQQSAQQLTAVARIEELVVAAKARGISLDTDALQYTTVGGVAVTGFRVSGITTKDLKKGKPIAVISVSAGDRIVNFGGASLRSGIYTLKASIDPRNLSSGRINVVDAAGQVIAKLRPSKIDTLGADLTNVPKEPRKIGLAFTIREPLPVPSELGVRKQRRSGDPNSCSGKCTQKACRECGFRFDETDNICEIPEGDLDCYHNNFSECFDESCNILGFGLKIAWTFLGGVLEDVTDAAEEVMNFGNPTP